MACKGSAVRIRYAPLSFTYKEKGQLAPSRRVFWQQSGNMQKTLNASRLRRSDHDRKQAAHLAKQPELI